MGENGISEMQVRGYYVASGFNGQGLSLAGGVGEVITDLICNEAPRVDISEVEVTRFIDLLANPQYLMERVPEVAGLFHLDFIIFIRTR